MILADASIWIEHFHSPNPTLLQLLGYNEIACHAFVIGEVSLGHVRNRDAALRELFEAIPTRIVTADELSRFGAPPHLLANVNTPAEYARLEALHGHKL